MKNCKTCGRATTWAVGTEGDWILLDAGSVTGGERMGEAKNGRRGIAYNAAQGHIRHSTTCSAAGNKLIGRTIPPVPAAPPEPIKSPDSAPIFPPPPVSLPESRGDNLPGYPAPVPGAAAMAAAKLSTPTMPSSPSSYPLPSNLPAPPLAGLPTGISAPLFPLPSTNDLFAMLHLQASATPELVTMVYAFLRCQHHKDPAKLRGIKSAYEELVKQKLAI